MQKKFLTFLFTLAVLLLPQLTGCSTVPQAEAEAQSESAKSQAEGVTPVDVAIASTGTLEEETEYVGTTKPVGEVSLRAQVEGRLLSLNVDVGDRVARGQILGQLDDTLLAATVIQGKAELAALSSELARTQVQVNNAQIQLERARVELQQAESDIVFLPSDSEFAEFAVVPVAINVTAARLGFAPAPAARPC